MSLSRDNDKQLAIFGLIAFATENARPATWRQIGTVARNHRGFLELAFESWPTNLKRIEIRPLDGRADS